MNKIENKKFELERSLYNSKDLLVENCKFAGKADGESPLKESSNIKVNNCELSLRYALWHVNKLQVINSTFTNLCRAPLWYCKDIKISKCNILGVKALRETKNIEIKDCNIDSDEFAWRCDNVKITNSKLSNSQYPFFESKNIHLKNFNMQGKYSFQYVKNMTIENSVLDTKDAFWGSKNITVKNSVIKGQYLAWYSDGLTLINCTIDGTQPLCYCKNLKLINCKLLNADLAFEYSDVDATIKGNVDSIKNPKSGKIVVDKVNEIILKDSKYKCKCTIVERKKK